MNNDDTINFDYHCYYDLLKTIKYIFYKYIYKFEYLVKKEYKFMCFSVYFTFLHAYTNTTIILLLLYEVINYANSSN